ncbi:hypothetical protein F5Y12DRAFT_677176 [Xylaria sp. FL1777]|nr:hypothetical protein F5Y12DRAFT_677176 [Xylaria sp. FL1777]
MPHAKKACQRGSDHGSASHVGGLLNLALFFPRAVAAIRFFLSGFSLLLLLLLLLLIPSPVCDHRGGGDLVGGCNNLHYTRAAAGLASHILSPGLTYTLLFVVHPPHPLHCSSPSCNRILIESSPRGANKITQYDRPRFSARDLSSGRPPCPCVCTDVRLCWVAGVLSSVVFCCVHKQQYVHCSSTTLFDTSTSKYNTQTYSNQGPWEGTFVPCVIGIQI